MSELPVDKLLDDIVSYALDPTPFPDHVLQSARYALFDTMGCAMAALSYPACTKLLGPLLPGTIVPGGARVPGTQFVLDPVQTAFNFGAMLRWLDYNDTWLAAEWGHPSDNLGAILPLADCLSQKSSPALSRNARATTMRDVLDALIRAYEIQGVLALTNSLNRWGFDHVMYVKIASAAACARLLGANRSQMLSAVSNAFVDNAPLRTYRHAPNTGSRKSWAAADASSRGLQFALMAMRGEMGYPRAISAGNWGFQDVVLRGNPLTLARPFGSFVMPNILFKVSYPAEFHAQTALEAAVSLHPEVGHHWRDIARIVIETHASAIRIIDKRGVLRNPADRDHCIQYIVAVGLLKGTLSSTDYEDEVAKDMRIDWLRARMDVIENKDFSKDYLDLDKRSATSAVTIWFKDGRKTNTVTVEYPLGHPRRRMEALNILKEKFVTNLEPVFARTKSFALSEMLWSEDEWLNWDAHKFVELFVPNDKNV